MHVLDNAIGMWFSVHNEYFSTNLYLVFSFLAFMCYPVLEAFIVCQQYGFNSNTVKMD